MSLLTLLATMRVPVIDPTTGYTYQLQQVTASAEMSPMDGNALVSHAGLLKNLGGWFNTTNSHNQQWHSVDGVSWTQQANAPWHKRHTFGHGVDSAGRVWIWGGDLFYDGTPPRDVWKYAGGAWSQVTNNWGSIAGGRVLFAWAMHKDYLYMAGGQNTYNDGPTMFTDIVRSADGITWTKVGDLPLSYFSTGTLISDGNNLYIMGGGRYQNSGHDNYNNKVYKSINDGATWVEISSNAAFTSMYSDGFYWDGKLWYLLGYDAARGGNQSGLYYSEDGITWTLLSNAYPARHATGITVHNDELFFVCGNLHNDVWKVAKVIT